MCISIRLVAKHWLIIGFNRKINQSGLVDRLVDTKIYQFIYKIYKIYTRYTRHIQNTRRRPGGGGPARPRGARAGPGPAPRGRAGPPPPGRRLVFCICLVYICIYLVYILYILYPRWVMCCFPPPWGSTYSY